MSGILVDGWQTGMLCMSLGVNFILMLALNVVCKVLEKRNDN
jgi:hypothetical protein